ncbi:MAG TPA: porin [Desulfuromonadales bacterium]|nr:porin [Desulfuromonadales bacterium]
MNLKKTVAIAAAAGALAAVSVPAMAFDNEFHGMYRSFGYLTNALSGAGGFGLGTENAAGKKTASDSADKYFEQRARIQYIAKASDDLKLVTHFELDTKFGGSQSSGKYVPGAFTTTATTNPSANGDGGGLDTDKVSLETKNVYLDFNCPLTGTNVKIGAQPYSDSMFGLFGNFDAAGVVLSKKFNALSASYGYFTVGSSSTNGIGYDATGKGSNNYTQDFNTFDVKYALSKDLTLGASYYLLLDKVGTSTTGTGSNHTLGLNGAGKFGPLSFTAALGYQTGKSNTQTQTTSALSTTGGYTSLTTDATSAYAVALATKTAVGPGNLLLSGLYLTGDENGTGKNKSWQPIGNGVTYFMPSNMWLLVRNGATINSSTAVGGSSDITRGGRGITGLFAGYEGTADKLFYNGNIGWAQVAKARVSATTTAASKDLGYEFNATVGYKLYSNLTASATAAYLVLGDAYGKSTGLILPGGIHDASNPYLTNIQLNYTF